MPGLFIYRILYYLDLLLALLYNSNSNLLLNNLTQTGSE